MNSFSFRITEINTDNFDSVLEHLKGYHKTLSTISLKLLGLPVLDGFILNTLNTKVKNQIRDFCNENNFYALLLRHDKLDEVSHYPRGGYLFSLDKIEEELRTYFDQQRIVLLLEPISPYDDLYSINILMERHSHVFTLEIVGPGFDASDLQRGDITPHEQIKIFKSSDDLNGLHIKRIFQIDKQSYKDSVNARLLKIGKRKLSMERLDYHTYSDQRIRDIAARYLEENNKNLLLINRKEYKPISFSYLEQIYKYIRDFPEILDSFRWIISKSSHIVLSVGIFYNSRINFWDIVWPDIKYKTF